MMKTLLVAFAFFALCLAPLGRSAESATVAGKWHFVLDTPGGDREMDSIFEQNGDKVTGKWAISDAKKNGDPVAGTFAQNQLALEFPITPEEAGPGTMKISGKLGDDGSLTGNWGFQDYSGTFKATRVKDDAK